MSDAGRLVTFALVLAAALGLGFGLGSAVGPLGAGAAPGAVENSTVPGEHGDMEMGGGQ